jgi:hypothetical protein
MTQTSSVDLFISNGQKEVLFLRDKQVSQGKTRKIMLDYLPGRIIRVVVRRGVPIDPLKISLFGIEVNEVVDEELLMNNVQNLLYA